MVTSTKSVAAFALFNMCISAMEKRLLQAEDGFTEVPSISPSLAPTSPPTYGHGRESGDSCGLALGLRREVPRCQHLHGDGNGCVESYVQHALTDIHGEDFAWAEPCFYWPDHGQECLPFPPCFVEGMVESELSESPSLSPTFSPTLPHGRESGESCGLELPKRKKAPHCQIMHGDEASCEGSYVQFSITDIHGEFHTWAEPCFYWPDHEECLPFPPCMMEGTVTPDESNLPAEVCECMNVMNVTDNGFEGTYALQSDQRNERHWWKETGKSGFEISYVDLFDGVFGDMWTIRSPLVDRFAAIRLGPWDSQPLLDEDVMWTMGNIGDFVTATRVLKAISIVCVSPEQCQTPEPTAAPSSLNTMTPTYSPTNAPTRKSSVLTRVPTMAPTMTQDVCSGKKKGKCKNTEGCRFVNNRKGCQIRIRPCSYMNKKNQCKNSQGCIWAKKGRACVSVE